MVKFSSSFFSLLSLILVTASVVPFSEMSREPDSPTLGAREPKHPLHLVNREATDRKARHIRPDYGAMDVKRETEEIDNLDYAARDTVPSLD